MVRCAWAILSFEKTNPAWMRRDAPGSRLAAQKYIDLQRDSKTNKYLIG